MARSSAFTGGEIPTMSQSIIDESGLINDLEITITGTGVR